MQIQVVEVLDCLFPKCLHGIPFAVIQQSNFYMRLQAAWHIQESSSKIIDILWINSLNLGWDEKGCHWDQDQECNLTTDALMPRNERLGRVSQRKVHGPSFWFQTGHRRLSLSMGSCRRYLVDLAWLKCLCHTLGVEVCDATTYIRHVKHGPLVWMGRCTWNLGYQVIHWNSTLLGLISWWKPDWFPYSCINGMILELDFARMLYRKYSQLQLVIDFARGLLEG